MAPRPASRISHSRDISFFSVNSLMRGAPGLLCSSVHDAIGYVQSIILLIGAELGHQPAFAVRHQFQRRACGPPFFWMLRNIL